MESGGGGTARPTPPPPPLPPPPAPDGGDIPPAPPGKPAGLPDKTVPAGPTGQQKDDGKGSALIPSDADAASNTRGAQALPPQDIGIKTTGARQEDPSGKGLVMGVPIDVGQAKSQSGAKQADSKSFSGTFNEGTNAGLEAPELRGAPAWGGSGPSGGSYGVTWLNAGIYTIPRRESQGILSAITGIGSSQVGGVLGGRKTCLFFFFAPPVGATATAGGRRWPTALRSTIHSLRHPFSRSSPSCWTTGKRASTGGARNPCTARPRSASPIAGIATSICGYV